MNDIRNVKRSIFQKYERVVRVKSPIANENFDFERKYLVALSTIAYNPMQRNLNSTLSLPGYSTVPCANICSFSRGKIRRYVAQRFLGSKPDESIRNMFLLNASIVILVREQIRISRTRSSLSLSVSQSRSSRTHTHTLNSHTTLTLGSFSHQHANRPHRS